MAEWGTDLVIQTSRLRDSFITVPCGVGPIYTFEMGLNTGRPLSYLSVDTYETVHAQRSVDFIGGGIYRLRGFAIGGQDVPDLYTRVSGAIGALGFDGMLGLHFLKQFRRICFDNETDLLPPVLATEASGASAPNQRLSAP